MIDQIPTHLNLSFLAIVFYSIYMLYKYFAKTEITKKNIYLLLGLFLGVAALNAVLGLNYFFATNLDQMPPRFLLIVMPTIIMMVLMLSTQKGQAIIDQMNLLDLTYFHWIRVPVELILYGLFVAKAIPEVMTFAGRNFDILAGITAPFVAYFGVYKKMMGRTSLIAWNVFCVLLLFNIIITAILSTPSPIQQMSFEQSNIAILHFPFLLLPAVVVPIVLFAHFVALRKLILRID